MSVLPITISLIRNEALTHNSSLANLINQDSKEWTRAGANCIWNAEETSCLTFRQVKLFLKHLRSNLEEGKNAAVNNDARDTNDPERPVESLDVTYSEFLIIGYYLALLCSINLLSVSVHND
jgi:hypothetical protein